MKKILSTSVALLILLNSFWYMILFFQMKSDIKKNIFEEIARTKSYEGLTCIKVSKNDFYNNTSPLIMKEENEFEYNGSMYDIVKKTETDNEIIFYCINDKAEENLIKSFYKISNDITKNKNNSPAAKTISQSVILLALLNKPFLLRTVSDITFFRPEIEIVYDTITLEILTPPPKISTFI